MKIGNIFNIVRLNCRVGGNGSISKEDIFWNKLWQSCWVGRRLLRLAYINMYFIRDFICTSLTNAIHTEAFFNCYLRLLVYVTDMLPSTRAECHLPDGFHGDWLLFDNDRVERVVIANGHVTMTSFGTLVCKRKHWQENYFRMLSYASNGW